jgi:small conductance mechanosensitive channel
LLLALISALGTLEINVSALVVSLGLAGFALGFSFKDFLSNLLSGVLILFYQPFTVGSTISGSQLDREVVDINLRYTVLEKEKLVFS